MKETWVIKIGSSLVTKSNTGLNIKNIRSWASQINEIINNNINVIIVSSGAIAEGMNRLGLLKEQILQANCKLCSNWSNGPY